MDTTEEKELKKFIPAESDPSKIDPCAPAGSKNALGAASVRDERPSTCDDVVEAMDEGGPGIPAS